MVFDASRRLDASTCKSLGGDASSLGGGAGLLALAFPVLLDLALDFGGGADDGLGASPVATLFLRLRASSLASDGMKSIPVPFV